MCGKFLPDGEAQVIAPDTTWRFVPLTRWVGAGEIDAAIWTLLVRNRVGNLQVRLAYQAAPLRTDDPSAPSGYPKSFSSSGYDIVDRGDLSVLMSNNAWVRFGIEHRSSSGIATGTVRLKTAFRC